MNDWNIKAFPELTGLEVYTLLKLRQDIFSLEQNCLYADIDGVDELAHHLMLWHGGELLAYSRCLPPNTSYQDCSSIGRVAVAKQARGKQLGRSLMHKSITFNLQQYPNSDICISAQLHLQAFYNSLGFCSRGEAYEEDGIKHIKMLLPTAPAPSEDN